jgi:DNA-3-methyladenine glycosylase II
MKSATKQVAFDSDAAVQLICAADKKLARWVARCGPYALEPSKLSSPFATLVRSIVYQQLHGKAAATILGRVVALFPGKFPTPQQLLDAPEEALRGAGLSRNKLLAVRDLAAKTIDGTVPTLARLRRMSDDEIVERLTAVRGIGRWTVEMMLMFRLGRPDVLPATDYGVRKGFARVYGGEMPAPRDLLTYGERWRPYRSVASWYFWRISELPLP